MKKEHFSRAITWASFSLLLGCSDNWLKKGNHQPLLPGERITVIKSDEVLKPIANTNHTIHLPTAYRNAIWDQAGGNSEHNPGHLALSSSPKEVWKGNIGTGASRYHPLISGPIAAEGKVFCLDTSGQVVAFDKDSGKIHWKKDSERSSSHAIGGGISYYEGSLFITSPLELLCLNAGSGQVNWRVPLVNPSRVSPTVKEGRVFVLTATNELEVFSSKNGTRLWSHSGTSETISLLGGASPAASHGLVIAAYSSGEIFALKAENGQELWNTTLVSPFRSDALSAIAHIYAQPVIAQGVVYAISHAGKMVALDLRTGEKRWENQLSSLQTPVVTNQYLFMIVKDHFLTCLEQKNGRPLWMVDLSSSVEKKEKQFWTGPLLAGERLVITNTQGEVLFLSPYDGKLLGRTKLSSGISVAPIIVDNTLVVLTNDGNLVALR